MFLFFCLTVCLQVVFFVCKMQLGQSQLFESLRMYLNNSRRQQPVIGLDSITECVTAGAMNRELLYFCNVCVCRCSKSDIRNHIFGSHHRFNYIKAWHPQLLITWQEENDLSAMAWPLMELAKMVEKKEGPGQAQLVEVQEALYQKVATLSETDAITLIILLRGRQTEVVSCADTSAASLRPTQPERSVLPRGSERSVGDDTPSHKASWENSENASFLDDYTGTKPLVGLLYVVEYRSEDGSSNCFLCHCCRVSSNKEEIIGHLSSSPHLVNYLMETCPEQVEAVSADREMLQSLAQKVAQDDCRGALKVVNVPESLCRLLAAESYHCCLKILRGEWKNTDFPENKDTLKEGPGFPEMSGRFTPQKKTAKLSTRKAKKMRNETETVFTVSLPLSRGPLLLERTSFAVDETSVSPSADLDQIHFPEYEPGLFTGSEDDGDGTSSCGLSYFQHDLHSEDEDMLGHIPRTNLECTLFPDVSDSPSEDLSTNQFNYVTETYERRVNNNLLVSLETSSETSYTVWQNEYRLQTPNSRLMPAVSRFPADAHWDGGKQHCYTSSFNGTTETNVPRVEEYADVGSSVQHYSQQLLCYQYAAGCAAGLPAGVPYEPSNDFYDPVPRLTVARTRMQAQYGDKCADNVCVVPETREQLHQGPLQTDQGFYGYWA